MNRAQLRAKAERRRMRDKFKSLHPNDPLFFDIKYENFLYRKGWMHNDPKKIAKIKLPY